MPDFQRCVKGIADAVLHEEAAGSPAVADDEVAAFLLATHERMPDHLRLALWSATLLFDAAPLATAGKPFHRLDRQRRSSQLRRWDASRIGAQRSLVAFYRTLAVYTIHAVRCEERETFDAIRAAHAVHDEGWEALDAI